MSATASQDPLFALYKVCQGNIDIDINGNRVSYQSVLEEIESFPHIYDSVSEDVKAAMIAADTMVAIDFRPARGALYLTAHGADVKSAAATALAKAQEVLGWDGVIEYPAENVTALLQELSDLCKASVEFRLNAFKGAFDQMNVRGPIYDATAVQFFAEEELQDPRRFKPDAAGWCEVTPEDRKIMEEKDEVLEVQFYPHTPVGFHSWYGVDPVAMRRG